MLYYLYLGKRRFVGVQCPHVTVPIAGVGKGLVAVGAGVGLVPRVDQLMLVEVGPVPAGVTAHRALPALEAELVHALLHRHRQHLQQGGRCTALLFLVSCSI